MRSRFSKLLLLSLFFAMAMIVTVWSDVSNNDTGVVSGINTRMSYLEQQSLIADNLALYASGENLEITVTRNNDNGYL